MQFPWVWEYTYLFIPLMSTVNKAFTFCIHTGQNHEKNNKNHNSKLCSPILLICIQHRCIAAAKCLSRNTRYTIYDSTALVDLRDRLHAWRACMCNNAYIDITLDTCKMTCYGHNDWIKSLSHFEVHVRVKYRFSQDTSAVSVCGFFHVYLGWLLRKQLFWNQCTHFHILHMSEHYWWKQRLLQVICEATFSPVLLMQSTKGSNRLEASDIKRMGHYFIILFY